RVRSPRAPHTRSSHSRAAATEFCHFSLHDALPILPVARLTKDESDRLLNMEEILHGRVIGQKEAVDAVSKAIRRARAGKKDPKRDRKSTRLNSSHVSISYAVFCLKKKTRKYTKT